MARKRLVGLYKDGKRNYEVCLIIHQRLSEEDLKKKLLSLKELLETEILVNSVKEKAEVVDTASTKIRSFSYAIQNNSNTKGYYACLYTKMSPLAVDALRKKISLESDVLRVLVVLANPKKQSYGIFSNQYETDAYKNKNKFFSYDDPNVLSRFLGEQARISERKSSMGKKPSKNQSKIQRSVSNVIKTSRFLSLLPYKED